MDSITVRMTSAEYSALDWAATLGGLSVSEFARRHRRQWEAGRVTPCAKTQNVTPDGPRDVFARLSGLRPVPDLDAWREALVRDARAIVARHRPPQVAEREGVDYLVEESAG